EARDPAVPRDGLERQRRQRGRCAGDLALHVLADRAEARDEATPLFGRRCLGDCSPRAPSSVVYSGRQAWDRPTPAKTRHEPALRPVKDGSYAPFGALRPCLPKCPIMQRLKALSGHSFAVSGKTML